MASHLTTPAASDPRGPEHPDAIAIEVDDVTKSFPTSLAIADWIRFRGAVPRRTVLHHISLKVRQGELFGLLGPNGAGKTTLLKMLATLCIPDSGKIRVSGIDAVAKPMAVKRKVGLCTSEDRSFYFRLSARANLRFFGSLFGLLGDELEKRVEEASALVDLSSVLDRRFDSFSSGMRQRLSIARSILGDPDIIFFDEPTRAVDPIHASDIRTFIRNEMVLRRGKTVILATNILEEAWSICDTIGVVQNGRIVAKGSPQELDSRFSRFSRLRIMTDAVADAVVGALRRIVGVQNVSTESSADGFAVEIEFDPTGDAAHHILGMLVASHVRIRGFRSDDPQPLDVFVGLTQNGNAD